MNETIANRLKALEVKLARPQDEVKIRVSAKFLSQVPKDFGNTSFFYE